MKQRFFPFFRQTSELTKLFIFVGILLFGMLFGSLLGIVVSMLCYGVETPALMQDMSSQAGLNIMRIIQICGQLGIFIFPAFLYSLFVNENPIRELGFRKEFNVTLLLSGVLLMFVALPMTSLLAEWNENIKLPEAWASFEQWMLEKETQATALTERFMSEKSVGALLFNLIMIGLLPALGEELIFRSVLQPLLSKLFKNAHLGIVVTAFLFSAIHMQFYGFLPRFVFGLFLGCFYYWSQSIWVPIVMHFFNNSAAVVVYWLHSNGYIQTEMENFGATSNIFLIIASILATALLLYIGWKKQVKMVSLDEN